MIFRLLFTLFFISLIDIYAFQVFRTLAQTWPTWLRNATYTLYWAVPIILVVFMVAVNVSDTSQWNKTFYAFFRAILFITYFAKFLMGATMLLDDGRRAALWGYRSLTSKEHVHRPDRSRFLAQFGLLLGAVPVGLMTYGILRNQFRYQLLKHSLKITDLPKNLQGLRIVQISDIHSGTFTQKEPLRKAIELINAAKPDLVFFTGDLVNNVATEMVPYMDVFDKIESKHGVFSIFGNHDYGDYQPFDSPAEKVANLETLKGVHKKLGWNLLLNEHRNIEINGEKVGIIGVENYSALPQFPKYGDLDKAIVGMDEATSLRLLLSHDPTHWDSKVITEHQNIDVTFSGHTHGFQFGIEIPGFFRWSPSQYMYPRWAGLYQAGKQYLYVNRGLGMLGYPGRVGILPEVTIIDLV